MKALLRVPHPWWLAGWFLLTWGIGALVLGRWLEAVWFLSMGLADLGVGGLKPLCTLLWQGLPRVLEAAEQQRDERGGA